MLSRLILQQFRSYEHLDVNFTKSFVVFHGRNGSGKTNILEAASLFTPGRGMRKAELKELQNQKNVNPWAVSMHFNGYVLGTGVNNLNDKRRVWFLNQEPMTSQKVLNDILRLFWLTPEMDQLFISSPTNRRQFLDRMIFVLYPEHANVIKAYEHAVKERLRLLTSNLHDAKWLEQLEAHIVEHGLKVASMRKSFLGDLPFDETLKVDLHGPIVDKETYLKTLEQNRIRDASAGMTLFGAHRCDMVVTYMVKNQLAVNCSTGEQKMLLAKIIIAFLKHLHQSLRVPLLLLFDDVISHLDFSNRVLLFEQLLNLQQNSTMIQVFLSGTEKEAFSKVEGQADFFEVNHSILKASL